MWSEDIIQLVWNKATKVEGYNEAKYRKDACGAWIARDKFGQIHNYGWEVDHIYPQIRGGNDNTLNLRALHYKNNRSKADDYPTYKAAVTAHGTLNIDSEKILTVNAELQQRLRILYGK